MKTKYRDIGDYLKYHWHNSNFPIFKEYCSVCSEKDLLRFIDYLNEKLERFPFYADYIPPYLNAIKLALFLRNNQ